MPQDREPASLNAARADSPIAAWLALAMVLIVCLPSLLIGVSQRLSTHTMENVALVTSQETWLRIAAGEADAWLVSTNDGQPRLEKPPLLAWLNLIAWSDLDPATASPQLLTFRARCVSAALGLLMLASIFWTGRTLGDVRLAIMAALTVGSTLFFQRQSRTASYDIHYVAWTTLAVAAGLWAISPGRAFVALWRRAGAWALCTLALSGAAMSKNPLPYLLALPPLIAAIVLMSRQRGRDALWLTAAALVSAAPVAAWYWHVFTSYQEVAEKSLSREVVQPREGDFQPIFYYLGLLGLVAPWSLWLIGGVIEPFKLPHGERRRRAMFGLFWFAFIFIALSIPAAKQQRYILAAMPAVGLLIAMFVREHDERAQKHIGDRLFEIMSAGLWIALALVTFAAPMFLADAPRLVGWFDKGATVAEPVIAPLAWPAAVLVGCALLALCIIGWRWHARQPWRSSIVMGLWMLMFMTVFWRQEAMIASPRVQPLVDEANRIRAIVGDAPIHSMRWIEEHPGGGGWDWKINEEFRLYFGRLLPRVSREGGPAWLPQQPPGAYVLVRTDPEAAALLALHGYTLVDHAQVDKNDRQELWRRDEPG